MAPLTVQIKYDELVRSADQPLSSYDHLSDNDHDDVIGKSWPFIIQSIEGTADGHARTQLARRLKIHFPLYSETAQRYEQKFPKRKPTGRRRIRGNDAEALSFETGSAFSLDDPDESHTPTFYVFRSPNEQKPRDTDYERVRNFIETAEPTSSSRALVFRQAIKECCRGGSYDQLKKLCSAANTSIERIRFENYDTVLHQCIIANNRQLTEELIRSQFDINAEGELGTPLVTAAHFDLPWAVEILLKSGADLTRRHIDWPFLTLYGYCIQFARIDVKLTIDRHLFCLIRQRQHAVLRKLANHGWTIPCQKPRYIFNKQYCR